jgi:hypothetical protein
MEIRRFTWRNPSVGGGLDTMHCALLMPVQRGDHPTLGRESMALRYARWEPPSFGYRPPNLWARAKAVDWTLQVSTSLIQSFTVVVPAPGISRSAIHAESVSSGIDLMEAPSTTSAVSVPSGSSAAGSIHAYPFRAAKRIEQSSDVRLFPSGRG